MTAIMHPSSSIDRHTAQREAVNGNFVWPRWWRLALLAAGTLILCSCSAPNIAEPMRGPSPQDIAAADCADAGEGCQELAGPPVMGDSPALPLIMAGPWAPPGISLPWPEDEYLIDGGDAGVPVTVNTDWEVDGLDLEDTVIHYDTACGERIVTPSNVVPIYAPRFGSVRLVTGPLLNDQIVGAAGVELPERLVQQQDNRIVTTDVQNEQPIGQTGLREPIARIGRQLDSGISTAVGLAAFQDAFLPYENIAIIRQGVFEQSEKPYLAEGTTAAVTWTKDQAVHVIIDNMAATEVVGDQRVQATYATGPLCGCPMVRIVKVASTQFARPGDTIDFTLRFDNVGTAHIGNVTIIDNLTTRLEYVPDSAQASVKAEFFTEPNQGDSLVLRWEITEPLAPGEGGICRFRCRVR